MYLLKEVSFFYLTVSLGSVQAFPAESCGEIKASEGNKMKNGEYWIYSDGNAGPAILATCQGTEFQALVTAQFESLLPLPLLIQ